MTILGLSPNIVNTEIIFKIRNIIHTGTVTYIAFVDLFIIYSLILILFTVKYEVNALCMHDLSSHSYANLRSAFVLC